MGVAGVKALRSSGADGHGAALVAVVVGVGLNGSAAALRRRPAQAVIGVSDRCATVALALFAVCLGIGVRDIDACTVDAQRTPHGVVGVIGLISIAVGLCYEVALQVIDVGFAVSQRVGHGFNVAVAVIGVLGDGIIQVLPRYVARVQPQYALTLT